MIIVIVCSDEYCGAADVNPPPEPVTSGTVVGDDLRCLSPYITLLFEDIHRSGIRFCAVTVKSTDHNYSPLDRHRTPKIRARCAVFWDKLSGIHPPAISADKELNHTGIFAIPVVLVCSDSNKSVFNSNTGSKLIARGATRAEKFRGFDGAASLLCKNIRTYKVNTESGQNDRLKVYAH